MKFYDFTKGGTDIVNQLNDYYSFHVFYILNTVRANSKTVWCLKNLIDVKKTNTFKFLWNLSSQLIKPFIENRQIYGSGTAVIHKMGNVLARSLLKEQPPSGIGKRYPLLGKIKRRCKKCEVGATKAVKDNLTKSKEQCKVCGKSVCRDHSTRVCCDCIEKREK